MLRSDPTIATAAPARPMLNSQTRALLDSMQARGMAPMHTLSVAEARATYRDRRGLVQPPAPEVARVEALQAAGPLGSIPLRHYRPLGSADDAILPALVYFHGGGWVIGDLDTHDTLCRELANGAGCAVVSVDYRLAPEHRFPAAVQDAVAATDWVHANAAGLKIDPSRIAVGGDSAGGNLAAVVAIDFRGRLEPPLAFQLLVYPATEMRRNHPSHTENAEGYLLTRETLDYYCGHYLGRPEDADDWRASPLRAADLGHLPPAFVLTAGYDPLRDEGRAYADALAAAGNRVTRDQLDDQIHGFLPMGKVLDDANAAVGRCTAELRGAFGSEGNAGRPEPRSN